MRSWQDGRMAMTLPSGEPATTNWQVVTTSGLVETVTAAIGEPVGRPRVIAVDGRGAAGKSTLTQALAAALPRATVVHTDDIAWHEPFFGWGHLLAELLTAVHGGRGAALRPPAWDAYDRPGRIEVPGDAATVLVEGTGSSPRECASLIDLTIWVQSDFTVAERRGIDRDIALGVNGDPEQTIDFWHEWMNHELAYFADQRPWERAGLVVGGTPPFDLAPGQWATSARAHA